jgi:hypothetical protein
MNTLSNYIMRCKSAKFRVSRKCMGLRHLDARATWGDVTKSYIVLLRRQRGYEAEGEAILQIFL